MDEQQAISIADWVNLRAINKILEECVCPEDPNKTRLLSVKNNIELMVKALEVEVKEALKGDKHESREE